MPWDTSKHQAIEPESIASLIQHQHNELLTPLNATHMKAVYISCQVMLLI